MVVRSTSATAPTAPTDGTALAVGSTALGAGTSVVANVATGSFTDAGLSANTQYYYYIYAYNSGCVGTPPKYLTTTPLTGNAVTCMPTPTSAAATALTTSGFTANWTGAASDAGYELEVSTSSTFATILAGYPVTVANNGTGIASYNVTGLSAATTYYYRVRATGATCSSTNSTFQTVVTSCGVDTVPTVTQAFTTYVPVCWTEATGAINAALTSGSSAWYASTGMGNVGTNTAAKINLYSTKNDWLISQSINLGAGGNYAVNFDMAITSYNGSTVQSTLGTHIVKVVVSTDNGATWTSANVIKAYTGTATYSNTGAAQSISLAGYTGTVKIGFLAETTSTSPDIDFHIDNFQVVAVPPVVTSFLPAAACVDSGASVTITGANLANATGVTVNGTAATITANTSTSLTFTLPNGASTGVVAVTTAEGSGASTANFTVNNTNTYYADADADGFGAGPPVLLCSPTPPTGYATNNLDCNDGLSTLTTSCIFLPLKVLIQGYYKGSGQMTAVRKNAGLSSSNDEVDEVTVALYSPSNVNQAVTTTTVVLATNGTITAQFDTTLLTESQYYIAIQHKNSIKTWSATPVAIINGTTYDFTTAASQAYGNNQIEVAPGIYAIYSGDMNQDGTINEADLPIFTTANTTAAHGYVVSDLNGDGSVDLLDYPIYKNNAAASIIENRPVIIASLPSVTIGTQVWQSSNLDVATYSDGTLIPQVTDPTAWANLTSGAWCYYNNDPANGAIYGKLYNWYAVAGIYDAASLDNPTLRKQLAPQGWHVPTDAEWATLTTFLGGESVAGGKMKAIGTSLWQSPNTDATNSSGFAGLPGGCRNFIGLYNGTPFNYLGNFGYCWSSIEDVTSLAWSYYLHYTSSYVGKTNSHKKNGFSVRCLRD
jgi:uncharacterized protein (TIGR02145 family)